MATHDHLNGIIDVATFNARRKEIKAYHLIQKEKPDAKGRVPLMCPALGASPTLVCPIREMMKTAAKKTRTEVDEENIPAELDKICQQHSVTFKESDIKRRSQGHAYGSKEWDEFHTAARNGVESVNAQIKKGGTADIESAARRRARGIAVAQVFVTVRIVQHNLERIADFLKQRFMKEEGILIRKSEPAVRSRDADWMNPYTKTAGTTNIPVIAPELDQPPLPT